MNRRRWSGNLAAIAACAGAALPLLAATAQAAPPVRHATAPAVALTRFAGPPPTVPGGNTLATNPDDITRLDDLVYVSFQNNAGKDGTPAGSFSTIAAYQADTGALVTTYQLTGRCDGLTADPAHHRLLATSVNEDNNSSLFVIHPGQPTAVHYTYTPDPAQTGSDGTNGGTDAISIAPDGTIYVAHSNPDTSLPAPNNTAAVYALTLAGSTATLTPLFGVNDTATVINPAPGAPSTAPLGLTDPDSNRFLSRQGGTLVQDSQADSKLVLATNLHAATPTPRPPRRGNCCSPTPHPPAPFNPPPHSSMTSPGSPAPAGCSSSIRKATRSTSSTPPTCPPAPCSSPNPHPAPVTCLTTPTWAHSTSPPAW